MNKRYRGIIFATLSTPRTWVVVMMVSMASLIQKGVIGVGAVEVSLDHDSIVNGRHKRLITTSSLWGTGEIHWEILGNFDIATIEKIKSIFGFWDDMTCVNFFYHEKGEYTGQRLQITSENTGCWSFSGKIFEEQQLNLEFPLCTKYTGDIAHEIGHALGLKHEHTRPDRDDYIDVNLNNADPDIIWNFYEYDGATLGIPYDYGSVMHYFPTEYSASGKPVITAKGPYAPYYEMAMGQRHLPSFYDIKAANQAYSKFAFCECPSSGSVVCKRGGISNRKKQCKECICSDGFGGVDCSQVVGSPGCYGMIDVTASEQCVETRNYEQGYAVGDTCNWLLKAPTGSRIDMYFRGSSFGIPKVDDRCFNWVELKVDTTRRGPRFCGMEKPQITVTSESDEAMINFSGEYDTDTGAGAKICFKISEANGETTPVPETIKGSQATQQETTTPTSTTTEPTTQPDYCSPQPCMNGGTCENNESGGYRCYCKNKYKGKRCQRRRRG